MHEDGVFRSTEVAGKPKGAEAGDKRWYAGGCTLDETCQAGARGRPRRDGGGAMRRQLHYAGAWCSL